MKRLLSLSAAIVVTVGLLAGCGASDAKYKDGTYEGQSSADERGAVGKITVTIKDGKITEADFKGYQKDGKVKDDTYGKTSGEENYKKAQVAVEANKTYGPGLVTAQDPEKVDAVSGATASYNQFKEAAKDALKKAE